MRIPSRARRGSRRYTRHDEGGTMKKILFVAMVFSFGSIPSIAQNGASVHGRVTDERNASVAGAEVQIRARAGANLFAVTDDNGDYSFKNVASGDYVLEVRAKGCATFASRELSLARGQSL